MAVQLDNLEDVLKNMAKLEKAAELEVIREVRKRFRATVRKYVPVFKKLTPKRSGEMVKKVKVRSKSRRGVSSARLVWDVPYSSFVNFDKNKSTEGFASDKFEEIKNNLDQQGRKDILDSFKLVFKKHGVKIK